MSRMMNFLQYFLNMLYALRGSLGRKFERTFWFLMSMLVMILFGYFSSAFFSTSMSSSVSVPSIMSPLSFAAFFRSSLSFIPISVMVFFIFPSFSSVL